ncbi:ATP-binding protein [Microbacterium oleivorans]|uniref:Sensor-like histidine kinase SenX3 n=1 Tax=Microbacterium oleivorans TaxID=273677 RepID=A0A031FKW7_9MICO|nr:PAS domain-containing sensor histidine kinase [Microbacterium oleivorans]EZP25223.1 PAS domain and PAC motif-containing protein [Microbacterium oleivorans]
MSTRAGALDPWVEQVALFAIVKLDPDGTVRGWNTGAELGTGYSAEEVVGHHVSRFYRAVDVDQGLPEELLDTARTHGSAEDHGWRVRKDGTELWAHVTVTAIYDDDVLCGFVEIIRDTTAEKRALDEQVSLQRTFAHDLMSPVTALSGYLDLLQEEIDGDHRYLRLARETGEHLAAMAGALMADALLSAREEERVFDVSLVVRGAASVVLQAGAEERIRFDRLDHAEIRGDVLALRRAFANVLENAARYSADEIHVDVIRSGAHVRVSVRDAGRGIHPDDIAGITTPGERGRFADPTDGGSGLGLASTATAIAGYCGTLEIDSEVGVGTTITITLPLIDAD